MIQEIAVCQQTATAARLFETHEPVLCGDAALQKQTDLSLVSCSVSE